jgi:mandelamide amidase
MALASSRRGFVAAATTLAALAASGRARAEPPGDLTELTATQALEQIRAGTFGAADYMTALAERARSMASLNALLASRWDEAIAEARGIDATRSEGVPLAGLPLIAMDNIDSTALPTTAGTPAFKDWKPAADAQVLGMAMAAGAVLAAKANLHELAFGVTSNNLSFGAVRNPYAPALIPGGSSGGIAAAVAARVTPWGLGSDTSGSARVPAALCGCIGFRPTPGRWAQAGMVPLSATFDTPAPLARSMADIVLLDGICADIPAAMEAEAATLKGLRLGLPLAHFYADLDPELSAVTDAALALLQSAGAELVEISIDGLAEADAAVGPPILLHEVLRELSAYLYGHDNRMSVLDLIDQVAGEAERAVLLGVAGSAAVPPAVYREALVVGRQQLKALYAECFVAHDLAAIVVPTTPLPARPIGEEAEVELNGRRVPTFATYNRNVDPPSHAGLPALSLPAGLTSQGLPVGLELVGQSMDDARLLAIAAAVEAVLPPLPPPRL